jgi:hypothetical protein
MKSVPNWISYPHEVSWNFSQLLPNCFELFSSGSIFNSKNHCCGVPPVSLSLSPHRARLSACRFRVAATRPCYPLKALADSASLLSEPRHHLAVGAPPDSACPNDAVSTVRARLTAGSRPAPPPVRPSRCRLPRVTAPPRLTLKPAAAPHYPLPICAGARREEPPHRWSYDRLHRCDPLHGERSPEHPLAAFSSGYTCA